MSLGSTERRLPEHSCHVSRMGRALSLALSRALFIIHKTIQSLLIYLELELFEASILRRRRKDSTRQMEKKAVKKVRVKLKAGKMRRI